MILFGVAIAFVIAYMAMDSVSGAYQEIPGLNAAGKTMMSNYNTRYPVVMDYAFLSIFLGAILGVLALVWFLDVHPVILFALIIVVVLIAAVAGYFANAWAEMAESGAMSAAITSLPLTNFILSNYLIMVGIMGFLALIVFFAKPGGVQ